MNITLQDIFAARERIKSGIYNSPCVESIPLSLLTGAHIYCKLDYLQRTGSFKERGARNALLQLDEPTRQRGVIAASAGNHALGVAYHGSLLNIPITVVMPRFAPLIKVSTCRQLGAKIILHGDTLADARKHALEIAEREGLYFLHPYDNRNIVIGQGTMALEILEAVPDVDAIVAPIGGGGLITGIAVAAKTLKAGIQVLGVEPEHAASMSASLKAGTPTTVEVKATLADGLAVDNVGSHPFPLAKRLLDGVVTVNETQLALAVLRLIELEKSVVEGAGAAPLAAFLAGKFEQLKGKKVVLCLCGGNIDVTILDRVIEIGMVADGRLTRFTATISDRPGGLARLTQLIAAQGANVKDIVHDRAFAGPDVSGVRVVCVVETSDHAHIQRLLNHLREQDIKIIATEV